MSNSAENMERFQLVLDVAELIGKRKGLLELSSATLKAHHLRELENLEALLERTKKLYLDALSR